MSNAIKRLQIILSCIFVAGIIFFLISFEPKIDYQTAFSATLNTFNNIGAGFATEHAAASFADYSVFQKLF